MSAADGIGLLPISLSLYKYRLHFGSHDPTLVCRRARTIPAITWRPARTTKERAGPGRSDTEGTHDEEFYTLCACRVGDRALSVIADDAKRAGPIRMGQRGSPRWI